MLAFVQPAPVRSDHAAHWGCETYHDGARTAFRGLSMSLGESRGVRIETVELHGDVTESLLGLAKRSYADCIAVGGCRHNLVDVARLGRVPTGLVRAGELSLFVVPA